MDQAASVLFVIVVPPRKVARKDSRDLPAFIQAPFLSDFMPGFAKGGEILIGEKTKELIDGFWPIFDRGDAMLKGIDKQVKIFSLLKKDVPQDNVSDL